MRMQDECLKATNYRFTRWMDAVRMNRVLGLLARHGRSLRSREKLDT